MPGMIRLRMNLIRNVFEHQHHTIPPHERPEVVLLVSAERHDKPQLQTIKIKGCRQIIHNKNRAETAQCGYYL